MNVLWYSQTCACQYNLSWSRSEESTEGVLSWKLQQSYLWKYDIPDHPASQIAAGGVQTCVSSQT